VYESFATVWERIADAVPDAPAVIQGERRTTYREVDHRAARLAAALADLGVGPDSKVALFLYNCPEYMECLFALSKLRAVPANVNFRYLGDELAQLVDNADADVLVYHRSLRDRVLDARDRMPTLRHVVEVDDDHADSGYEELLRSHDPAPRIERSGDDLLLWYTGGTTGLPKGVLWHQGTLLGYGLIAAYALQDEAPTESVDQLTADARRWRDRGTPLVSLLTTPLVRSPSAAPSCCSSAATPTATRSARPFSANDRACSRSSATC
jgi:3-oxocholest-4-en-26-oate---CoA ligase